MVLVGNGNSLTVEGMVREVEVQNQGHSLELPVYLLPVSDVDVVLGAAWLAKLGSHVAYYSDLTLKFLVDGNFITFMVINQNFLLQPNIIIFAGCKVLTPSLNYLHYNFSNQIVLLITG